MDVSQLTDAELRESLKEHGFTVGPIVSSTRKLYEKKLQKFQAGKDQSSLLNDSQTIDPAEASFSPIFKNVTAAKPASSPKETKETKITRRSAARSQQQTQQSSSARQEPESSDSDDECEESMRYLTEEEMAADRAVLHRSYTNTSPFKVTRGSIVFWSFVVLAVTFLFFSVDNYVYKFIEDARQKAAILPDEDPI